ncbi:MAG: hypothetical protein J5925_01950, partial [Clostridia bacterium]|nr:hypothetical protein [Clostridia bacterium]
MKKIIAAALCLALALAACGCSGGNNEKSGTRLPRAFNLLQKETSVEIRARKGESVVFTGEEFAAAVGADPEYITVTSLPAESEGALLFRGTGVIRGQTLPQDQLEKLRFVPAEGSAGGGFGFTCGAPGWKNCELRCNVTLGDGENLPPTADSAKISTAAGISCPGQLRFADPDGDECTLFVVNYPEHGEIKIAPDGGVVYTPGEGFAGTDKLVFRAEDRFGAASPEAVLEIEVAENSSGIRFADMDGDPAHLGAVKLCESEVMTYKSRGGEYIFEPDGEVARIDFVVMLTCAAGESGGVRASAQAAASDGAELPSGLKGYLAYACESGF